MVNGNRWTRDELLIAMNVYDKLPFGQFDQRNPVVKDVAKKLNRTPSSLAMKLSNLASLDPAIQARGRKGLPGASNLDRMVWNEFRQHPEVLSAASEELLQQLFSPTETEEVELVKDIGAQISPRANRLPPVGPTEKQATVAVRRGQQFFRQMILNAFEGRCCITGIKLRELLVASHIKPWGAFPDSRLDIANGLCLSSLHDAAFDRGLISFDSEKRLILSKRIKAHLPQVTLEQNFVAYEGKAIRTPESSLGPSAEFLRFHRDVVFQA
jgi:putative restriction endonuclease